MGGVAFSTNVKNYLACDVIVGIAEMNMHTFRKVPFRCGFTLIELLVVIAVISMLLSMMLPGLKGAKEAGKQVACLSNIRQLTMGWTSYNADNEGRLCAPHTKLSEDTTLASRRWVMEDFPPYLIDGVDVAIGSGVLYGYVNDPDAYKCASDRFANRLQRSRSFAMAHGMGSTMIQDGLKSVTRVTRIKNTSGKIVFADAEAGENDIEVSKSFCPVSVDESRWMKIGNRCFISVRHKEGSNFTFADGHAEQWKWKDRRTVDLALAGNVSVVDAAAASLNNEDLARMFKSLRVD